MSGSVAITRCWPSDVGSVERGEYKVTILTLRKFTKALGISLHDAIRGIQ